MSIKVLLKANKINAQGKSPLYLRLIKNRKTKFISLGIYLNLDEWDPIKLRVKSKHPNSARVNHLIISKLAEAETISLTMHEKDRSVSASKIRDKIKGKSLGNFTTYAAAYLEWLEKQAKIGTYIKVKASLSKLSAFNKHKDLQFEDINFEFLKKYERHLTQNLGNATNTVHGSFRTIRKLLNDAIREGIIDPEHNPFLRYKLKTAKTNKTFLTDDEIDSIENLTLVGKSKKSLHRDIFVFACYAGGLRVSDILKLKWRNFSGSHLTLITQKTTDQLSIPLPNKALALIYKYAVDNCNAEDFIFPILKNNEDYTPMQLNRAISSATAYLNKDLKSIGGLAEINKSISMHTSRHSWATRALKKGIRIEHVSALMGHSSIKTTQIYAKIVNGDLDKAMEAFNE